MMWGYGYDGGPGWAGWLMMSLFMLALWGAVVAGVVLLARSLRGRQEPESHADALRILDERLARGEIDAEEYSRRRRLLISL